MGLPRGHLAGHEALPDLSDARRVGLDLCAVLRQRLRGEQGVHHQHAVAHHQLVDGGQLAQRHRPVFIDGAAFRGEPGGAHEARDGHAHDEQQRDAKAQAEPLADGEV